jgi:hypothetical protein
VRPGFVTTPFLTSCSAMNRARLLEIANPMPGACAPAAPTVRAASVGMPPWLL